MNYNNTIKLHKYIEKSILSLLPSQDLYRLRRVCKRWNTMLTDICNKKYKVLMDAGQFLSTCSKFEQKILIQSLNTRYIKILDLHKHFQSAFYLSHNRIQRQICKIKNNWMENNWVLDRDKYICHVRTEFDIGAKDDVYLDVIELKKYNGQILRAKEINRGTKESHIKFYQTLNLKTRTHFESDNLGLISRDGFINKGEDAAEREDRRLICDICERFFTTCDLFNILEYECNYP